jgi:type I restriction enzyme S subunit
VSTELPQGWTETSLGQLANYVNGKAFNKLHWKEQGLPIIRIQNLNNPNAPFNYSDEVHEERYKVQKDDLLIAWSASLGAYIWKGDDAWLNQHIFRVEPYLGIVHTRYLYYAVTNSIDELYKKSHGMGMVHVTKGKFEGHGVWLPPLNEQIRIADKLDSVLAKVDAAQARLEKIPTLLKRFRQSVLAAATSGELTREWREKNIEAPTNNNIYDGQFQLSEETLKMYDIPETWRWVALGNYAKCNRGKFSVRPRNDPSCFEGEYPFIQIGDLPKDGGFVSAHNQTLNEKGFSVSKMFDAGTVVIAIVGATIANTGILKYPMCFPDSLVGINSPSITGNIYVDYYLRANKEDIRQVSYAGGGQPNIKLTVLNPLPFPLPPQEEQKEIVRRVESLFTLADTVEKQYLETKKRIDRLTQSLLAKAFRGELVPQDPNDEPAAELLKRIQAERNAQPPVKNKRKQQA